jgi:hypothetical protein
MEDPAAPVLGARRWLVFLQNHREAIAAFDFFNVPTVTFQCCTATVRLETMKPSFCGSPWILGLPGPGSPPTSVESAHVSPQ